VQAPVTMIDTKQKLHALNLASWFQTARYSSRSFVDRSALTLGNTILSVVIIALFLLRMDPAFGQEVQSVEAKAEAGSGESTKPISSDPAESDAEKKPNTDDEKSSGPVIAIVNATVHTMVGPAIERGRIVVKGKSIESVGDETLVIPEDAQIIDALGLSITPGWIDVKSQLWMSDSPADSGASDGSLLATDSLDPFAEDWADVLNSGVTTVYVQPSSVGAMSGLGAAVSVAPSTPGSLEILNPTAGLQMSLGNAPSNRDRAARFDSIKKTLQSVIDYKKKWDDYEKAVKEESTKTSEPSKPADAPTQGQPAQRPSGEGGNRMRRGRDNPGDERRPATPQPSENGPPGSGTPSSGGAQSPTGSPENVASSKDASTGASTTPPKDAPKKPVKPERDLVKDRLIGVITGKIPVRFEVRNANDVRYASELKKSFSDVQWVWEGLDQLGSALPDVKNSRAPIVVGPFLSLGIPAKTTTARIDQLSELLRDYQGVVVVQSNSNIRNGSRLLREQLASSAAVGVRRESLLKSVTLDAARLIGCEKQIGAIAPGYKADLVGFLGNPLDTTSPISLIIANGKLYKQAGATAANTEAIPSSQSKSGSPSAFGQIASSAVLKSAHLLLPDGLLTGELSVEDGKIAKINRLPPGSSASSDKVVDVHDAFVTPGLVSVYSSFGLDANARGTDSDSSNLIASDLSLSDQRSYKRMEGTGLFKVALTTSSANTLAGQLSLFSTDLNHSKLIGAIGAKLVLSSEARSLDRFPSSLAGQVKFVRDALEGKRTISRLFVPDATLSEMEKSKTDAINKLLERKQLAIFQVSDEAEIEAAIRMVRDYKLRAAFVGSTSWGGYSAELKELGIAIIASPVKEEDFPIYIDDLVVCHKSGVDVYFGGETGVQIRATAGLAVRHGMDANWARFAIFNGYTKLFPECDGRLGFMEGEPADFLVWSGDPLNLSSTILARVRSGKVVASEENQ
jgi:imidazolonepropionase-like amidohydrolase